MGAFHAHKRRLACGRDIRRLGADAGGRLPWGNDDSIINTRAYVVSGADITPDLMTYLLKENAQKYFGAFGIEEGDYIVYEHGIVGSRCDKEELKAL